MPKFSAFTRYGHLAYSGSPSEAEKIYSSIRASQGDAYLASVGGHVEATTYARAMAIACARLALKRAYNQNIPGKIQEMLPAVERSLGIIPKPAHTIAQRNEVVRLRMLVSNGATAGSLDEALRILLGDDFIKVIVPTGAQIEKTPATPADGPGIFSDPKYAPKIFQLVDSFSPSFTDYGFFVTWHTKTFQYASPSALAAGYPNASDDGVRLQKGDVIAFGLENSGNAEKLTIESATDGTPYPTATASFTRPHGPGESIRTGPAPVWRSSRRTLLVLMKEGTVTAPIRRAISELLERMARGVTRWSVIEVPSPYTTIPAFTVGQSLIGISAIGSTPFPF